MKVKELVNLKDEELQEKLKEAKNELFNLRFQLATGQLENHMKIREIKRNIARIQTVCRERELKEQKGA
ncbi:50S ribosomal protein L29 [Candidatus Oleimmundimicrobium sp.]|uniref:50S ribosomal protein L29 n=1 Tax=Candidatus Oleimmundimicrobium sp. TaxID=3060597 RepID=UPI00271712D4|nr:50S ribosomal protein L29 [Candidatus Oleimmundimicrobium sp.]MDO8886055.1 50S ribosomal protein L29 [Candidatus Oleimmundimicrobium sp.]